MLTRTDTPWYPNVRLFRQPTAGDWASTMNEVLHALQELVASHKKVQSGDSQEKSTYEPTEQKTVAPPLTSKKIKDSGTQEK